METAISEAKGSYQSPVPWQRGIESDVIVIHCSDYHFKEHFDDFIGNYLKISHPTHIVIPGGVTLMLPLIGKGFKFGKQMIEFVSDISKIKRVICIAHEDCMMYKEHKVLNWALGKAGKNIKDIQLSHLKDAASTFNVWFPNASVEAYYADVEKQGGSECVVFTRAA